MVQVPELFTQYISSFSGCMGGNPNAPIWLVVDHSARCPLPIDPEKVFANPVTNIDALKRALPTSCSSSFLPLFSLRTDQLFQFSLCVIDALPRCLYRNP